MHILVLTDRDWTHPQGGGTGTNLFGQISRWLAWGHRVTVVASSYPGAVEHETLGNLTIHRMGGRGTVFPRAIWKLRRGLVPDADVVLEVVNGITFLTPLWLTLPRLTLIHHVHHEHYAQELGRLGRIAAFVLETAPLRWLYSGSRFQTLSRAEAEKIASHGIDLDQIDVNYIGVETDAFRPGERAAEPTLLYLGRLKKYKRIELLLDVLEAIPDAVLEVAGEGDHRPDLEAEIERRGLGDRVRMHGHVSEERKTELYARAWANLTASSAEGWCLAVMEAAACGTPSVALAVGGLPESIDDGRTGLLARDESELAEKVRAVISDPAERDRLGTNALERAREFTWDAAARRSLDTLTELSEQSEAAPSLRTQLAGSDIGRAAGLAGAVLAGNVVALIFTIVFARILGASGYGTLAALVSTFLILQVPGSALQITVARDVSTAIALDHEAPAAGIKRWLSRVAILTLAVAIAAAVFREQIAAAIGVEEEWAAAATLPTGCLWLLASIERGALQGFQRYRAVGFSLVGEGLARLMFGLILVGVGLGVTGAFLGTGLSVLGMALVLAIPLRHELQRTASLRAPDHLHRFRDLVGRAWVPVAGLALLLILQEIHVIVVKHEASDDAAGAYAAAAVAAKAIIWVAVGLGLYLLPEAARRAHSGVDARPVLSRTLALIAVLALPMVLVYAVAARPLLEIVFGENFAPAAGALPWLGLAMALLACAYLAVQYLLALGKAAFIVILGIAAIAEPLILLVIGAQLRDIALALFGLQAALAAIVVMISFRSPAQPPPRAGAVAV